MWDWWMEKYDEIINSDNKSKENDYEKYIKVVYRSEPIGKDRIILELMTFDLETFERNKGLKEISTKKQIIEIDVDRTKFDFQGYLDCVQKQLESMVIQNYANEIKELKTTIENMRRERNTSIKEYGDIANCNSVICDTIKGDVINCSNVKCNKIEGDTINCNFR